MTDTRIPPSEPGAAPLAAGRCFRTGTPAPDLHSVTLTGGRRAGASSGAMYRRAEDGIVLVDQDRCRGWRMCVSRRQTSDDAKEA